MKVKVHYFGQLRQIAKTAGEERELEPEASAQELIRERAEAYGAEFGRIAVSENGEIRTSLMVLLNGKPIDRTEATALSEGDEISLLTAIAGG